MMNAANNRWLDYAVLTCAFFLIIHHLDAPRILSDDSYYVVFAASAGAGDASRQIGIALLFLYGLLTCLFTKKKILNVGSIQQRLGLAFLVLITVSISWSAAPAASLARWAGFTAYTLAAIGAVKRLSTLDLIRWYVLAHSFYLMSGLINEFLLGTFKPFAEGYRFCGLNDPNSTGTDAVVLIISSVAMLRVKPRSWLFKATLVTGVPFLLLTKSRAAVLSIVFTLLIFYALVLLRSSRLIPYLSVVATVASALLFIYSQDILNFKSSMSLGREEASESTMTGRIPLWTELYENNILSHPVLGYGYGGFWTPAESDAISFDQGWTIGMAHSIYIDATLALGVVGLGLYLVILISVLLQAVREARLGQPAAVFFGCLVLGSLLDGITDSGPWINSSIYLFICIQALVVVSSKQIQTKTKTNNDYAVYQSRLRLLREETLGEQCI